MEFGSDFHSIRDYPKGVSLLDKIGCDYRLYTDGRQALEAILVQENIKRVWIPSYYCHESIAGIKKHGINVIFYPCHPLSNPDKSIQDLPLKHGDALVRMNYFGLNKKPQTPDGHFFLIEDHSHNLTSQWAMQSDADWCFASLRKTLPIADGGILWSPKNRSLPLEPQHSQYALQNAVRRYGAMDLKADYLAGKDVSKESFLKEFRVTEDNFEQLTQSAISNISKQIIAVLDISKWYRLKKQNWKLLHDLLLPHPSFTTLIPEEADTVPFSLTLIFSNYSVREKVRHKLIADQVYPAVLWTIPGDTDSDSVDFGNRMLSIHCDARYSQESIRVLADRINNAIKDD